MKINNPLRWLYEKKIQLVIWVDSLMYNHIDDAIRFTNAFKKVVNSNFVRTVVLITPDDTDDKVIHLLNDILHDLIPVLTMTNQCKDLPTKEERLTCFVEGMRKLHPDLQDAIYFKLASLILRKRSGDKNSDSYIQARIAKIKGL